MNLYFGVGSFFVVVGLLLGAVQCSHGIQSS